MKTVTVKYQTQRNHCHCCGHKLEKPKTSEVREFRFKKDDFIDWLSQENWQVSSKYEDEINQIIQEFVYETISFFATNSDEIIHIDDSEFEQVKKFALEEVC